MSPRPIGVLCGSMLATTGNAMGRVIGLANLSLISRVQSGKERCARQGGSGGRTVDQCRGRRSVKKSVSAPARLSSHHDPTAHTFQTTP